MSVTYSDAKALIDELDADYSTRHSDHRRLRDFWHGRYWEELDSQQHGIASLFRDNASTSDYGPDMKLVRNLVFDVCVKYQSFLSGLPMIRTFTERPESRRARAQAATKERALYGAWSQANMNLQLNRVAWFGPLMGDCFLGIWPNLEVPGVRALVRSPEHAYPVPSFDGTSLDAILFRWQTTGGRAKRSFPGYSGAGGSVANVEVLEYSDARQFRRWVDSKLTNDIQHNLGFNLFDQVPFIHVPGEPWNHGAVEQAVNLVWAGNALWSLEMQAAIDNVFQRLVLEDPMKFGEDIDTGPGAVIPVNPGGKAYYLQPAGGGLAQGAALMEANERAIKQTTSMPDVSFGQVEGASVMTGKAVNALQGAGTGSLVEMVQAAGIGTALEAWNEKALTIFQRMFPEETISLYGMQPSSGVDLNPRQFAMNFKGKEIVGSPRNEVVFSPYIDMHGKLVMGLQALGAGLVSKTWAREQIGVSDSEQMQEEITEEVIEEAVIGAMMQALQADASADNADQTAASAVSYLSGEVVRAPVSPSVSPADTGAPAAGTPPGGGGGLPVGPLPGGGAVAAPAINLPPGSALGPQSAPPEQAPAPASSGVTVAQAQAQLAPVSIEGRAWLIGEIAVTGHASEVEVAVTNPDDRQALGDAAQFPVSFQVVQGEPQEQAIEIGSQ